MKILKYCLKVIRNLEMIKPNILEHLGKEEVGNAQENVSLSFYLKYFFLNTEPQMN